MKTDFLQDALSKLIPNFPDWYGWAKTDSNGNKIPNDQRMQTQHVIVNKEHEGKVARPTNKEIDDKVKELEKWYADNEYQRKRLKEYNAIGLREQLDMIYHNIDAWKAEIKKVKDAHPKGG